MFALKKKSTIATRTTNVPVEEPLMPGYESKALLDLPGTHEEIPAIVITRREHLEQFMRETIAALPVDELTSDCVDATLAHRCESDLATVNDTAVLRTQQITASMARLAQVVEEIHRKRRDELEIMRRARADIENMSDVLTGHVPHIKAAAPIDTPQVLPAVELPTRISYTPAPAATLPAGWVYTVGQLAKEPPAAAAPQHPGQDQDATAGQPERGDRQHQHHDHHSAGRTKAQGPADGQGDGPGSGYGDSDTNVTPLPHRKAQ